MPFNFAGMRAFASAVILLTVLVFSPSVLRAQTAPLRAEPISSPTPAPKPSPKPSLERRFFANIVQDQRAIWLSPFHFKRNDVKFVAPVGLGAALLIATDRHTAGGVANNGSLLPFS